MLCNIILYIVLFTGIFIIAYVLKPLFSKIMYRLRLENEFIDFLSIILTLEASGLRIDNVFEDAVKNRVYLPRSYLELARQYSLLSKINPDPYTCIRRLSATIPSGRVRSFFKGYSEVLISSNDTLSYVESFLKEEFNGLRSRINSYASLLDNLFESYLIILLGIMVYSILPFIPLSLLHIMFILSIISISAYYVSLKLSSLALYGFNYVIVYTTAFLLFFSPIIIGLYIDMIWLHMVIVLISGFLLWIYTRSVIGLEDRFIVLLEDIYSNVRQGYPLDHALILTGFRSGEPVRTVSDLLRLGFKPYKVLRALKLPPLPSKILGLVLAPIEYSKGFGGYIGYILRIVDNIRGLRRVLVERGRIYMLYIIILVGVAIAVSHMFSGIGFIGKGFNKEYVIGITYISVYESLVLAGIISRGYWFTNPLYYILLPLTLFILETMV